MENQPSRKTCPAGIGFSSSAFQRNSPTRQASSESMDSFIIKGNSLRGDVTISGSKNAVAANHGCHLLTGETCTSAEFPT